MWCVVVAALGLLELVAFMLVVLSLGLLLAALFFSVVLVVVVMVVVLVPLRLLVMVRPIAPNDLMVVETRSAGLPH